jgi:hypothetical protein
VWAAPVVPGAINEKTRTELRSRINGTVPAHGTMRLACQAVVNGDIEVRTRAGFEEFVKPNPDWAPDPRPSKWKERWEKRNDEPDEDEEKPKKKAATAKPAAAKPVEAAPAVKTTDEAVKTADDVVKTTDDVVKTTDDVVRTESAQDGEPKGS